ncbi:MAG: hypothetical protein KTR18_07500 [Acidiferrobacterales bacterium]|nr:hypothetical protein [Acidiferrobacterales bacterium]
MQVLSLNAQGFQVLVPVNMVAQILGTSPLDAPDPDFKESMPFLCGKFGWREFQVPLFDISALHAGVKAGSDYERMVVLWPLASAGKKGFFALTSLGPPRVVEITDQPVAAQKPDFRFMSNCVTLSDGLGVIPDLQQLSDKYYKPGIAR